MTEQWQELKETIKELRYSNGDLTQQELCSFLGVYMETLEKQMQESTYAKGIIIKSALKYLVKRQIEEGSVGFAVDNDHDHDCCWDDVLAWIEAQSKQPWEEAVSREAVETFKEELIDKLAYTGYTEEYKDEIIDIINQMPPVIPQRKKGKWIIIDDCEQFIAKCSECGRIEDSRMISKYPYCHCGARMVESQEVEETEW